MRKRRLVFSDAAIADILEQADWYAIQSGQRLSRRWEKAVSSAISYALKSPAAGTPCTFRDPTLRKGGGRRSQGFPNICSSMSLMIRKYSYFVSYMAPAIWSAFFRERVMPVLMGHPIFVVFQAGMIS
jgi:plasmid stabilization system protein ParE